MRILKKLVSLFLLALVLPYAQAQTMMPRPMAEALQRAQIPREASAVYVAPVGGGAPMLAWNENLAFNPASTMKLVTTFAALDLLGPAFRWKTGAWASGPQEGDVLRGDLVIKGGGDPKLVYEHLWMFLRRLRERGIREIQGDLVLDRSVFEETAFDPAQFDGEPQKPYNVGPDALLLNYKSISLRFLPDPVNGRVNVVADPPLAGYPVVAPRLAEGECADWRAGLQTDVGVLGVYFSGVYPAACGERVLHLHPWPLSHPEYFHLAFRRLWTDLGGTLRGGARLGVVPPDARLIDEWESPSLAEVVRDINKFSNNVMARQLLLTLGHVGAGLPVSAAGGATAVRNWMTARGIPAPELVIENGSGLSRAERISAQSLARMLDTAFQSPAMPEFLASLPLAGLDGTMRRRLNGHSVAGRAHVKTGLLADARNIAGYVLAASGRRYIVVCLINHTNAPRAVEAQDALLQWIYEKG
ncbi:D-alanyl-D-alanine carboxypeptidase/D-alanyl-D-alanine endopeptidase [Noviherbaspirillum aridicola]|uniref:D-alanyl-D-alanine carboxypeptidase n=1 Tax=Noviherbaspirillum aridicola TaxID=2849687 RepID=A0ABQ4Q440_9BURK|nr:D-alanyl-D-alanine carboxypeptidase/D-alanyl-D-alanine-endopeptidase [Noviherbaspirillum aridicola]GIZ51957.1 D-alanyl-D-alanine carboxypeptidase [Noviherbaspirillum aridicola]